MNSNETSILPHTVTLTLVNKARVLSRATEEKNGSEYAVTNIILDTISIVCDNAGFEVEMRITKEGFQLAFPQVIESDVVLAAMDQGFEVLEEMLLED